MRLFLIWLITLLTFSISFVTYAVDFVTAVEAPINAGTACGATDLIRTFDVTDNFIIADVDLGFQAEHTWRGDIDVRLQSPAGTIVQVIAPDVTIAGNIDNYNVLLDNAAITPINTGFYMTPGNEILYRITVNNSAAATAEATNINIRDTLPDNLTFISATTTGFTGGAFGTPALPAANTDCSGGNCIISFAGGSLAEDSTDEIIVRAIIQ